MGRKAPRRRQRSRRRYHKKTMLNNRRGLDYTPAGEVTIIDANSGEIVDTEPPLDEKAHERLVSRGNRRSDPSMRATKRRRYVVGDE